MVYLHNTILYSKEKRINRYQYEWISGKNTLEEKIKLQNKVRLHFIKSQKCVKLGFPGGTVVENLPANAGDTGSSPGLGRSHMPQSD